MTPAGWGRDIAPGPQPGRRIPASQKNAPCNPSPTCANTPGFEAGVAALDALAEALAGLRADLPAGPCR
ncbi:MAG: hypothetical protein LBD51_05080 [Bifidobacteriaceae bacterium]|nr:hypothetical protein [Bifidobacteriaceae bacterium]